MRIIHVSTDDVTGGAARNAYRLHRGLLSLGHSSTMLVKRKRSADPRVERFRPPDRLPVRLRRRFLKWQVDRAAGRYSEGRPDGYELFTDDRCPRGLGLAGQLPDCDVVQLHWVSGLVDFRDFFGNLEPSIPVVWRLADMNVITGGCHYTHGCERFTERCGACPQLGSKADQDLSREIWRRKRSVFASFPSGRLHFVTPSRWLAGLARRSSVLNGEFPVSVIPNGLDTDDFAPRNPSFARRTLGIPGSARVLLFVAHDLRSRRKGFAEMRELVGQLSDIDDLFLLSVGKGAGRIPAAIGHRHVDYTEDDRLLSLVYSSADVFVIPSRQDNLPTTVLESLACGTPVVGFETGGIPEMVRPGETGRLVPNGDVAAMRRATRELLAELRDASRAREYRSRCRSVAVEEYDTKIQTRRYERLYRTLLGEGDSSAGEARASGRSMEASPAGGRS